VCSDEAANIIRRRIMDDSEKLAKIIESIKGKTYEDTARIILNLAENAEKLMALNKQLDKMTKELLDDLTVTEPTGFQRSHWSDQALDQFFNDLLKRTERSMTLTKKLSSVMLKVQQERKRRRDRAEAVRAKRGSDE
jgi:enoyl reductase-like protein